MPKILLVEDNEDTTLAMTTLLTLSGHTVESAANVEEAKQKSASARFDLLISDIGLPDGDGTDVVKVFVTHQNAPSIAMTVKLGRMGSGAKKISKYRARSYIEPISGPAISICISNTSA